MAWSTAAGSSTTIDFEGIAASGASVGIPVPPGLNISGVNFSADQPSTGSDFILAGPLAYGATSVLAMYDASAPRTLVITLPGAGSPAVAFDLGRTITTETVTIMLSTGDSFTAVASPSSSTFVGFTSTAPIKTVSVVESRGGTNVIWVDNVSFVVPTATAIPTLSSWAFFLLTCALAVLGLRSVTQYDCRLHPRENSRT